jgi:hypothetical protein
MTDMTRERIAALLASLEYKAPLPWIVKGVDVVSKSATIDWMVANAKHPDVAQFIAAAPALAATALAALDREAKAYAEIERLRGLVLSAYVEGYITAGGQWQADNGWNDSESRAALGERP